MDAVWRALRGGPAEAFLAAVDLIVSVRTELLDSRPEVVVQSVLPVAVTFCPPGPGKAAAAVRYLASAGRGVELRRDDRSGRLPRRRSGELDAPGRQPAAPSLVSAFAGKGVILRRAARRGFPAPPRRLLAGGRVLCGLCRRGAAAGRILSRRRLPHPTILASTITSSSRLRAANTAAPTSRRLDARRPGKGT